MELLQKLVRANALLLQGAYQGVENLLDSAIVDARTLLEENARLQSEIDAANAQKHIGYMHKDAATTVVYKFDYIDAHKNPDMIKVYARPIPAQQSPWIQAIDEALVVHHVGVADVNDNYDQAKQKLNLLICAAESIGKLQSPAVAVPELRKCCGNPVMDNGYVCCGEYLYGDDAADQDVKLDKPAMVFATTFGTGVSTRLVVEAAQRYYEYRQEHPAEKDDEFRNRFFNAIDKVESPRITEQYDKLAGLVVQELYNNGGPHESQLDEARRIIGFIASRLPQRVTEQDAREIAKSVANVIGLKESIVDAWFDGEGRDLLAKLNKV